MPRSFRGVASAGSVGMALGLLVAAGPAAAGALDWASLQDAQTVEVLTSDEDGSSRDTTVWLVVVDGAGYVRTGSTRWGDNVVRTRELELRASGSTHPMRVEFVEDEAARQRVTEAFSAKYGFSDRMVSWMRGPRPKIMLLQPRE